MSIRKNLDELYALIDSSFADNTTGAITPESARNTFKDIVLSVNPFQTYTGYGFYKDSSTSTSKMSISQNTPTVFNIDKAGVVVEQLPTSYANTAGDGFYDESLQKVIFDDIDGHYIINVSFKYSAASATSITSIKLNLDDGLTELTGALITGTNNISGIASGEAVTSSTFTVYMDTSRLSNGLKVIIETEDANFEIWENSIEVVRVS